MSENNKMKLDLSIIITLYNRRYLALRALKSCLNLNIDKYISYEVVIIDDGSTDNPKEIIGSLLDNPFVSYYYQDNSGAAAAKNLGAHKAKGKYILFLDSDDLFANNDALNELPELLLSNPDFIYSQSVIIKKNDEVSVNQTPFKGDDIYNYLLAFPLNYAGMPSYIFNREKFLEAKGFNMEHKWGDAMSFWRVFLKDCHYKIMFTPNYIYDQSITSDSISRNRTSQYYKNVFKTLLDTYHISEYEIKSSGYAHNWVISLFITSLLSKNFKHTLRFGLTILTNPRETIKSSRYIIKRRLNRG